MSQYATAKKGLSAGEITAIGALKFLAEPKYADPPVNPVSVEMSLDYDRRGHMDNVWGTDSGKPGSYIITTARVEEPRGTRTLNSSNSRKGVWINDAPSFRRAWTCAAALWNIGIPNFAIVDPESSIEEVKSEGREIVRAALDTYPLSRTRMSDILASQDTPIWEVMSLYMQVILAISHANMTARFAHNALVAANVVLAPYAPIFVVNYRCEHNVAYSLLCFKHVSVITNYHHGQVSYVADDGKIVQLDPERTSCAINYDPDPSSDIYRFTADCLALTKLALLSISKAETAYNDVYARQTLFKDFLAFYIDPKMKEYPENIGPHKNAGEYAAHVAKTLKAHGIHIMRSVASGYGNYHLTEPPIDRADIAHPMAVSTWHGLDLRCLVARGPYPRTMESCIAASQTGYHLSSHDEIPVHRIFPCSYAAHLASERLILNPTAATHSDIAAAAEELPFFLCAKSQYASI
jgi:hypothetical protein